MAGDCDRLAVLPLEHACRLTGRRARVDEEVRSLPIVDVRARVHIESAALQVEVSTEIEESLGAEQSATAVAGGELRGRASWEDRSPGASHCAAISPDELLDDGAGVAGERAFEHEAAELGLLADVDECENAPA